MYIILLLFYYFYIIDIHGYKYTNLYTHFNYYVKGNNNFPLKSHVNSELLGILNRRSNTFNTNLILTDKLPISSKLSSGIYTTLPLGHRIINRISNIFNVELYKLGAVQLSFPLLNPDNVVSNTGNTVGDSELFKVSRNGSLEYRLSGTCEDLCNVVLKNELTPLSKLQLPVLLYQINTKFRDELRVNEGKVRLREFLMLDLYSLHSSEQCSDSTYSLVLECFVNILRLLGLQFTTLNCNRNNIFSHELRVQHSNNQDQNSNTELEVGHLFKFGTRYSDTYGLEYEVSGRRREKLYMNSYGIGINRLLNVLINNYSDEFGIKLPQLVAPYDITIIDSTTKDGWQISRGLMKKGLTVLYDDRNDTIKNKLLDSKRIGIPHILILGNSLNGKNRLNKKLWESINENCKISNYYNLHRGVENIMYKNDNINLNNYSNVLMEYHPRTANSSYIINLSNFLKLLNI
uniref:Prolyl-t-RNA synthase, putative n=1 Tax=Theileria annulata TaxID=5874 RepID=A0A3B0MXA1_THEAN